MIESIHIHRDRITEDRHIDISRSVESEVAQHIVATIYAIVCIHIVMEQRAKRLGKLTTNIDICLIMYGINDRTSFFIESWENMTSLIIGGISLQTSRHIFVESLKQGNSKCIVSAKP